MSTILSDHQSLIQKASLLHLSAFKIAEGMRSGNFSSIFKGHGVEFTGVREYLRGDDIRSIDWNVTARMGKPFIKMFEEDRELVVFLVVDRSFSMNTGFASKSRLQTASEAAALLAFAAEQNNSPIGAVLFDGQIQFSVSPKSGKNQTMLLIKQLDNMPEEKKAGSSLASSLQGAYQHLKNRSLVLILSDFRTTGYEKQLAKLAEKHDVIAIRITDISDFQIPKAGYLTFKDPETDKLCRLPTSSSAFQKEWKNTSSKNIERWRTLCLKRGVVPHTLSTNEDIAQNLITFFSAKELH